MLAYAGSRLPSVAWHKQSQQSHYTFTSCPAPAKLPSLHIQIIFMVRLCSASSLPFPSPISRPSSLNPFSSSLPLLLLLRCVCVSGCGAAGQTQSLCDRSLYCGKARFFFRFIHGLFTRERGVMCSSIGFGASKTSYSVFRRCPA